VQCGFDYCVYNRWHECVLDEVQINQLGMCDSCELVTVPKEHLEKYKKRRLKEIENIWANYDI